MPKLVLASGLARWLGHSESVGGSEIVIDSNGDTVGNVLQRAFSEHPTLRGYVLDDCGTIRHHVAIFVDGTAIRDKTLLQTPVSENSEIYIMQALSGG